MCFSANISLLAFILGIIGSILVFTLGGPSNKIISLFFAFVSSMQLIEYFLWKHQVCDNYNKLLSKIGMWLNHMQPVVLGLLVIILSQEEEKVNLTKKFQCILLKEIVKPKNFVLLEILLKYF